MEASSRALHRIVLGAALVERLLPKTSLLDILIHVRESFGALAVIVKRLITGRRKGVLDRGLVPRRAFPFSHVMW